MKKVSLKLPVIALEGAKKEEITLPKEIFGIEPNHKLISQAVHVYLNNQRQGNASTKTRGDVRGSGKKIYRQKGTGRARHGDRYAPIFVGGGVAFGPKPKDWSKSLSKPMRKKALFSALSAKLQDEQIVVVDSLQKIKAKTADLVKTFKKLDIETKKGKLKGQILVSPEEKIENLSLSGRNVEKLTILPVALLNTYEVLKSRKLVLTKKAVEVMEKTFLSK